MRKEVFSDTDEPSLESCVVDNVMAVFVLLRLTHWIAAVAGFRLWKYQARMGRLTDLGDLHQLTVIIAR